MSVPPILETEDLQKFFILRTGFLSAKNRTLKAVDGVSLSVDHGETLSVVGESGCGKSTFARMCLGLLRPDSGKVSVEGQEIGSLDKKGKKSLRKKVQVVFQNPYSSLNPRMNAGLNVAEPLFVHGMGSRKEIDDRVHELFEMVGLKTDDTRRYPHQFSGGQRQRICVARALALNPKLIVCDEPVSALDVSIQAQILILLDELQEKLSVSYLFISHDLSVVKMISDRVAVMYLGKIAESGKAGQLYSAPLHPYTRALLDSVPIPDPSQRKGRGSAPIKGDPPSPIDPPSGCRFHTRCPRSQEICEREEPQLTEIWKDQFCACHFPLI